MMLAINMISASQYNYHRLVKDNSVKRWQMYYDACSLQTASIIVQPPLFQKSNQKLSKRAKWEMYYDACCLQRASIIVQLPPFQEILAILAFFVNQKHSTSTTYSNERWQLYYVPVFACKSRKHSTTTIFSSYSDLKIHNLI